MKKVGTKIRYVCGTDKDAVLSFIEKNIGSRYGKVEVKQIIHEKNKLWVYFIIPDEVSFNSMEL